MSAADASSARRWPPSAGGGAGCTLLPFADAVFLLNLSLSACLRPPYELPAGHD